MLTGKRLAKEFKAAYAEFKAKAKGGSERDVIVVAQLANNRFACIEDDLNPDAGWTTQTEVQGTGVVETQSPAPLSLQKHPEALAALNETVSALKFAAEVSPAYGLHATRMMVTYKDIFKSDMSSAYLLASRAQVVFCLGARPAKSKQQWDHLCGDAKSLIKQMTPFLGAAARVELDGKASAWAGEFASKSRVARTDQW